MQTTGRVLRFHIITFFKLRSGWNGGASVEKLCYLGPFPAGAKLGPTGSGFVGSALAGYNNTRVKSDYRFMYVSRPRAAGRVGSYKVYACSLVPGVTGQVYYDTDQSEVIRMNRKQRAGPQAPPLGG